VQTRETYIQAVRAAIIGAAPDLTDVERTMLAGLKMVYGSGAGTGARGVTYFKAWNKAPANGVRLTNHAGTHAHGPDCGHDSEGALIELCAFAEESVTQLCGTTAHELAHALAGHKAAHGKDWKAACVRLGLRTAKAAGTTYRPAMFSPRLRDALVAIPLPTDGKALAAWGAPAPAVKGTRGSCSHGRGSRGGTSRGKGSGSRLRKWVCGCGVIARVASDDFKATCGKCGTEFKQPEAAPAANGSDPLAALVAALVGGNA